MTALGLLVLTGLTERERFDLGFVPEFRRYLTSIAEGTSVFTHRSMREMTWLIDPNAAARIRWLARSSQILPHDPVLEAEADQADQFWYARKLAWLTPRKELEKGRTDTPPPLASYFAGPERDWKLMEALTKDDAPEFVFYRRRTLADGPSQILTADDSSWQNLLPALPAVWTAPNGKRSHKVRWEVPPEFRGRLVRFEIETAADEVHALGIRPAFRSADKKALRLNLRPYSAPLGGLDFFALRIPPDTTACEIELKFSRTAERVELRNFRAVLEPR